MKIAIVSTILLTLLWPAFCQTTNIAWGDTVHGTRLGLYFEKSSFSSNEDVTAFVLLENVTDVTTRFPFGVVASHGFSPHAPMLRFNITGPQREAISWRAPGDPRLFELEWISPSPFAGLAAHGIVTNKYRLNRYFDFTRNGDYLLTARSRVGQTNARETIEVISDNVLINVEGRPPSIVPNEGVPSPIATHILSNLSRGTKPRTRPENRPADSASPPIESTPGNPATPNSETLAEVSTGHAEIKKVGLGLTIALTALLLIILWRASRRGKERKP